MTREAPTAAGREIEPRGKQPLRQESTRPGPMFSPDVDIVERPDEYVVTADLPGVGEEDLRVQLENGVLSIDARPSVRPDDSWQPLYGEYRIGGYHREFTMGDRIDAEKISAQVRDGVLEIHLPKRAQHQPRRIAVARG